MKKIKYTQVVQFFLATALALVSVDSFAQIKRVTNNPPYNGRYVQSGISFNVGAGPQDIKIRDFGVQTYTGNVTFEVWYKTTPINQGSSGWYANASNGWVKVGAYSHNGNQTTPTSMSNRALNVLIPAGKTYGFFIVNKSSTRGPWFDRHNSSYPTSWNNNGECILSVGTRSSFYHRSDGYAYNGTLYNFVGFVDYELARKPNAAKIGTICSPTSPTCGNLINHVTASILNNGKNNLDSVMIGGRVHYQLGAVRDTAVIPNYQWKGSLLADGESKCDTLFNWGNGFRTGDSLYLWTIKPNGDTSKDSQVDTTLFVIRPNMTKGVYTIGDTLHDFQSVTEAISMLCDTFGGICDTVIFELDTFKGSYQYYGQYNLCKVAGTSWNAPVIFRSNPKLSKPITLLYDSCWTDENYVFNFDGSDHIILENLNFRSENGYNTNKTGNIQISEGTSDIRLLNCNFSSSIKNSTSGGHTLVASQGAMGDNIEIKHCNFTEGSIGLSLGNGKNHSIMDNDFTNQYLRGLEMINTENSTIENNDFSSTSLYSTSASAGASSHGVAIYLKGNKGAINVSLNRIKSSNGQWPVSGIAVTGHNSLGAKATLFNNQVNIGQAWSSLVYHGIHCEGNVNVDFYYNTVAVTGNNTSNASFYAATSGGVESMNNILAAMSRGYCYDLATVGSMSVSDYNDLYSPDNIGRYNGVNLKSLANWQSVSQLDSKSISANPAFYNIPKNDLHVCNIELYRKGISIPSIPEDFDGDKRDAIKPCIGADEFAPVDSFSLGTDFGLCPGDSAKLVAGEGNFGELAIWKDLNSGQTVDTTQILVVNSPGKYEVTLVNACGIKLDSIEVIQPDKVVLSADSNLCPDETYPVDATITNGSNYAWSNGETTANIVITSEADYSIVVTDKWGCMTMDTMKVTYSDRAKYSKPQSTRDTIVCEGSAVTLAGSTVRATDATYKWDGYLGANQEFTDNVKVDYLQINEKDTVYMELTHRGCVTTDTVTLSRLPKPKIVYTNDSNGLAFIVTSNASSGSQHLWTWGDGDSSTFATPRHLYSKVGTYTITYTNKNICGEVTSSREFVPVLLNVDQNELSKGLVLFPNPNNGRFNILLNSDNRVPVTMTVLDVDGKVIFTKDFGMVSGNINQEIKLNKIVAGSYFLNLTIDGHVERAKFIVE